MTDARRPGRLLCNLCILALSSLVMVLLHGAACARAAEPDTAELRIDSLASVQAFAADMDSVRLVGTIRNSGKGRLAENVARARLVALSGLDYLEGDTSPWLPALDPGASVTFRWKLSQKTEREGLVVSLAVRSPGMDPVIRVESIPQLAAAPRLESAAVSRTPFASDGEVPTVENSRIRARVLVTESGMGAILLSVHTRGGWRQVGTSVPLAEVLSAEGGQIAWWEVFKVDDVQTMNAKDQAGLSISGAFGIRWRATIDVLARTDSAVLDLRLRLSPTRPMRLHGIRFAPFLAGEGSFGSAVTESLGPGTRVTTNTEAVRWGEITTGALRTAPALGEWSLMDTPGVEGAEYRLLSAESLAPAGRPAILDPGAMVEIRTRLFALTPSSNVRDALKVSWPVSSKALHPAIHVPSSKASAGAQPRIQ